VKPLISNSVEFSGFGIAEFRPEDQHNLVPQSTVIKRLAAEAGEHQRFEFPRLRMPFYE
jgi:hypothetical protein